MIRLHLLGGLSLTGRDGAPRDDLLAQPKPVALLAYLALAAPAGFRRRDELLGIFWPEVDTTRGRRALSQALFVLRSALGTGAIVSRGAEEVGLDPTVVWTDVVAFRIAADHQADDEAMALYRGELLPAFHLADTADFDQWLERERAQLRDRAARVARRLSDSEAQAGRHPSATTWARRAVDLDLYDEHALRRLLQLLHAQGDRTAAIRAYEAFAERLRRDLSVGPSAETSAIIQAIRSESALPPTRRASRESLLVAHEAEVTAVAAPNASAAARAADHSRRPARWRRALLLAAPLFGIAGIVGARELGFVGARPSPDRDVTGPRRRVIVADFVADGRDSTLAATVTELVSIDVSRSPMFEVMTGATLHSTLQLMRRDTLTAISPAVAREIAERESIGAVIEGDLRRVGPSYVLSARLVTASTGALIRGWRAESPDSAHILSAITTLSESIRRDAGESMASAVSNPYVYRVSTTSLEALRRHARGEAALYSGDLIRSVALFEEAVRIDSTFADAWVMLATVLTVSGVHPARQIEALRTAYGLRDRLTPAERYGVVAAYLHRVRGDVPAAIAAYRSHAELAPREVFWAIYGGLLIAEGDVEGAARELARGVEFAPTPSLYAQLAVARVGKRDLDGARRAVADGMARFPSSGLTDRARVDLAVVADGYAAADSVAHGLQQSLDARSRLTAQALIDAARGNPTEAMDHLRALSEAQRAGRATGDPLETALLQARLRLTALGDTAGAMAEAERVLRPVSDPGADPRERPYVAVAHLFAEAGRPKRATALIAEYERNVPEDFRAANRDLADRTRAMIDVLEGRRAAGVEELRADAEKQGIIALGTLADLAWAYDRAGSADSAAAVWRRYLAMPYMRRLDSDAFALPAAHRSIPERTGVTGRARSSGTN